MSDLEICLSFRLCNLFLSPFHAITPEPLFLCAFRSLVVGIFVPFIDAVQYGRPGL